jgi:hypothetical protein
LIIYILPVLSAAPILWSVVFAIVCSGPCPFACYRYHSSVRLRSLLFL